MSAAEFLRHAFFVVGVCSIPACLGAGIMHIGTGLRLPGRR